MREEMHKAAQEVGQYGTVVALSDIYKTIKEKYPDVHRTRATVTRTMQRRARGTRPKNPTTIEELADIYLNGSEVNEFNTVKDERFYDGIDMEHKFCVYSIKHIITKIQEEIPPHRLNILVDATFQIVPANLPFTQIMVLNVQYFSQVFPFAYVLMRNKSQASYAAVFKYIHENVMSLQCHSFTSDYEVAMRNAFRLLIDNAQQFACHFHFCQAVKRKAHECGLNTVFNTDPEALNLYQRLQSIPLLPAEYIQDTFQALSAECRKMKSHTHEWDRFMLYYSRQWINKETAERISVNKASMRTTSAVESINHRMSLSIVKRGGYFQFLKGLVKESTAFCAEFDEAIRNGGKTGSTMVINYMYQCDRFQLIDHYNILNYT